MERGERAVPASQRAATFPAQNAASVAVNPFAAQVGSPRSCRVSLRKIPGTGLFSFVMCAPSLLCFTVSAILLWKVGSHRVRHLRALRAIGFPLRHLATCNLQPACCRIEAILQQWWGPQDPYFGCKFICHLQQVCCRFGGAKNAKGKVPPASLLRDVPELLATHRRC